MRPCSFHFARRIQLALYASFCYLNRIQFGCFNRQNTAIVLSPMGEKESAFSGASTGVNAKFTQSSRAATRSLFCKGDGLSSTLSHYTTEYLRKAQDAQQYIWHNRATSLNGCQEIVYLIRSLKSPWSSPFSS